MPFSVIPASAPAVTNNQRGTPATSTTTTAATTAANISTAKNRLMLTIFNESNGILFLRYGGIAANIVGNFDMKILPNTIYEFPGATLPPNTDISGIWISPSSGSLTGSCTVFETV